MQRPEVSAFYDARTGSVQYVVSDRKTKKCAIIDPVLDFDEKSGSTATTNADAILAHIADNGLMVEWILDTHPHADHFSAAQYLKSRTGAPTAIGEKVRGVQEIWKDLYNRPDLACDAAFIHDTLFMPDSGSARADFPGGSAAALWNSIQAILALPDDTRLFTGHDYRPNGRAACWESSVAEQKKTNPHVCGRSAEAFIHLRESRDRTLPMPRLILHALQINICGGRLPKEETNGTRYLKIPLDALPGSIW